MSIRASIAILAGAILREDVLPALGLSVSEAARQLGRPARAAVYLGRGKASETLGDFERDRCAGGHLRAGFLIGEYA